MFDSVIEYYYIVPLLSFLILIATFSINHWDMTEIEKKFITRFRRVQIEVSIIFIETIIVGVVFVLVLNKKLLEPFNSIENVYEKIFLMVISLFLLFLPFILIVNGALWLMKWLIIPETKYFVYLNQSNEKWVLERTTIKGQILLRNENADCVFLKEWDNLTFNKGKTIFPACGKWIYKNSKRFNLVMVWLTLSLSSLIIWSAVLNEDNSNYFIISSVLFMTMLWLTTIYFCILKVKKLYL